MGNQTEPRNEVQDRGCLTVKFAVSVVNTDFNSGFRQRSLSQACPRGSWDTQTIVKLEVNVATVPDFKFSKNKFGHFMPATRFTIEYRKCQSFLEIGSV